MKDKLSHMQADADLRKAIRKHYLACNRLFNDWAARDYEGPPPHCPPAPEGLCGMTCGAKTRKGTPCKQRALHRNSRCKLHGGNSTGPKTTEGKRKSAANLLRHKRPS